VVDTLRGEAFGFLGFDLRRVRKRRGDGYFIRMTPKKKARTSVKAKVRDIIRHGGATPMPEVVKRINATLGGWVNYFRVGNSSRAFSEVRDYVKMKVRTLLTRRTRRRKSSVGWRRWSNEYLYDVLGLYWDWKIQPLPGVESFVKAPAFNRTHKPYDKTRRVSCLRENLTSSSYGEGLETGESTAPVPYPTNHFR
jgi:RNA-directed DNA polymerase